VEIKFKKISLKESVMTIKSAISIFIAISIIILILSGCSDSVTKPQETKKPLATSTPKVSVTIPPTETPYVNNEKIVNLENFDKTNVPLIAALKNDNIYLYGLKPNGVVLYNNGLSTYFDWCYLTPRRVLPQMLFKDFDNDGIKELAVLLYIGSGTGVSIMDLHMVEKIVSSDGNEITFKDIFFGEDSVTSQVSKAIKTKFADEKSSNFLYLTIAGKTKKIDITSDISFVKSKKWFKAIYGSGCIIKYEFVNGEIIATIGLGIISNEQASPTYIGNLKAKVKYKKAKFSLTDFTFEK
jgi:hypothetical protein